MLWVYLLVGGGVRSDVSERRGKGDILCETEADGVDRVEMAVYLENDFRWSSDEDQMERLWFLGYSCRLRV
jgi:hypothetical protein